MPLGKAVVWNSPKQEVGPKEPLSHGPKRDPSLTPWHREPQVRCSVPVMLPGGYKMSFHLKLHKFPAHKKTVITKAATLGKNEKKKKRVSFLLNIRSKHF